MNRSPIATLQNRAANLRLLLAQRRLYSDVKNSQHLRLSVVFTGSAVGVVVALLRPSATAGVGVAAALALLLYSAFGLSRERRKVREAAAVQEEFDCAVFALAWNAMGPERPTPEIISDAAGRSRQQTVDVEDWYPDPGSTCRPLDVLLCQRSNFGWGTTLHRQWAATVLGCAVAAGAGLFGLIAWQDMPLIAFAPLLVPAREVIDIVRTHWDSAIAKQSADAKVMTIWRRALDNPAAITDCELRSVQDRVLAIRQINASVPDWFHSLRRANLQASMLDAAAALVAEAASRRSPQIDVSKQAP